MVLTLTGENCCEVEATERHFPKNKSPQLKTTIRKPRKILCPVGWEAKIKFSIDLLAIWYTNFSVLIRQKGKLALSNECHEVPYLARQRDRKL